MAYRKCTKVAHFERCTTGTLMGKALLLLFMSLLLFIASAVDAADLTSTELFSSTQGQDNASSGHTQTTLLSTEFGLETGSSEKSGKTSPDRSQSTQGQDNASSGHTQTTLLSTELGLETGSPEKSGKTSPDRLQSTQGQDNATSGHTQTTLLSTELGLETGSPEKSGKTSPDRSTENQADVSSAKDVSTVPFEKTSGSWSDDPVISTEETEYVMTSDVVQCIKLNPLGAFLSGNKAQRNITSLKGVLHFDAQQIKPTDRDKMRGFCRLHIIVPEGMVLQIHLSREWIQTSACRFEFFRVEISDITGNKKVASYCDKRPAVLYSTSSKTEVRIEMYVLPATLVLSLNWTAISVSERPHLERIQEQPNKGYLQTPGWDRVTEYPPNMDSWIELQVNPYDAVMVNTQHMYVFSLGWEYAPRCIQDKLTVYIGGETPAHTAFTLCGRKNLPLQVVHTDQMHFHFQSDSTYEFTYTGFKLYFSFHNNDSLPQKLSDGKWNCTVSHWNDFQEHFPCNLVKDCDNGEDEALCPYTSARCGLGSVDLGGGSCYHIIRKDGGQGISWRNAITECASKGGYLASLNTISEWRNLTSLIIQYEAKVLLGLQYPNVGLPPMYREMHEWADGSPAYLFNLYSHPGAGIINGPPTASSCMLWDIEREEKPPVPDFHNIRISSYYRQSTIPLMDACCEIEIKQTYQHETVQYFLTPKSKQEWLNITKIIYFECPDGHMTHDFLSCDPKIECLSRDSISGLSCESPLTPAPPMLRCKNGFQSVPYTLVCDFLPDCSDHSDEDFCVFAPCLADSMIRCGNKQCVPATARCDGLVNCKNGMDEMLCVVPKYETPVKTTMPPPAIVHFNGHGGFKITSTNSSTCPESYFRCGSEGYCLPVFVRCNGVNDCPGREDEAGCDSSTCRGFYRCRDSHVCLHPTHLCDGVFQCPQQDDELFCNLKCPSHCTCYGQSFFCQKRIEVQNYTELRFLHAANTDMIPKDVSALSLLIYLGLPSCHLRHVDLPELPNLRVLDLSFNNITVMTVDHLRVVNNLIILKLTGNPLIFPDVTGHNTLTSLYDLDISHVSMAVLNVSVLSVFPSLQKLNLSGSGVGTVTAGGFAPLTDLRVLDVTGCPLTTFTSTVLKTLTGLQLVLADNFRLCCPDTLPPGFNSAHCHAPSDEISSCESLLRSNFYRGVLSVYSALALLGNFATLSYRLYSASYTSGYVVFVTHLCMADLLMGVYLAAIGVADYVYQGTYLWKDVEWKNSAFCRAAGFLSLLSSEVSAFVVCLITLDRFLVLRFPFSRAHFRFRSAQLACALVWCVGIVLAMIPLLPAVSHWRYYSQTGICIPLPILRKPFAGYSYSFGVMIVLNVCLFLLIAVGQLAIYWSIRANSMSSPDSSSSKSRKDLVIARRLFTVVMSNFVCWFPIGLLGLLAAEGTAVSSEVNVAMAILVLPVNSALNPFLYTLNTLLEKRRRVRDKAMMKRITAEIMTTSNASRQTWVN